MSKSEYKFSTQAAFETLVKLWMSFCMYFNLISGMITYNIDFRIANWIIDFVSKLNQLPGVMPELGH